MALRVIAVSISVSPFLTLEEATVMFMTSAPSRFPASSKEDWVRVDASKNRLICVRPRKVARFFSTWREIVTASSARSRSATISSRDEMLDTEQMALGEDGRRRGDHRCWGLSETFT